MKIVFLTIDDHFFLPVFFKIFFQKRAKDVAHIIILSPKGYYRSAAKTLKNVIVLYGLIGFFRLFILLAYRKIVSYFAYLIKRPALSSSVKTLARLYAIAYSKISDIDDEKTPHLLKSIEPDVIFSVSLPQVIPAELFNIAKYGSFNIHTSLLPKYRGVLPVFWALLNGEKKIGSAIHTLNEKIDSGNIVMQDTFDVEPGDTLETCIEKGKILGANLALKLLERVENQTVELKKMNLRGARYYSFPTRRDVDNFKKNRRLF